MSDTLTPTLDSPSPAAPEPALRTDSLAGSVLILLSLMVVQRLVGFLRAVLFCRWLDAEQLGQWDMSYSFLVLAGPLVVLALPAAFGRYVEHYRQREQLQTFVRRSMVFCAGLAILSCLMICLVPSWFSTLVYGDAHHTRLILALAASLLAVVAFNFTTELFTALRNVRLVSLTQLLNSLIFAGLGLGLLCVWQDVAESVVLAYGGACVVSALVSLLYLRRSWSKLPQAEMVLSHRDLWGKVIPFAGWIWSSSLLSNLFDVADRYMILHCTSTVTDDPLALVGQYHSSRLVPLLLVSVATMLGTMMTPHLSHDWEEGRRELVSARLNLFLKLMVFALTLTAIAVLLAAPLLFGVAFRGKFHGGEAVLPWTLTYCIWFATLMVAQNYLWCAEKARLASVALFVGLAINVALNLLLLPSLGLPGAVLATSVANLLTLVLILLFNRRLGFRTDRGTWLILAVPPALTLGPWLALLVLGALALAAYHSDHLLSAEEKRLLAESGRQYLSRIQRLRRSPSAAH